MIYRLLIFLLFIVACQRKTVSDNAKTVQVNIDTTFSKLISDEIPINALKDIHHLLQLGYVKAGQKYDSIEFQMYFNEDLIDSIQVQTSGNDTVFLTIGNIRNKSVALYTYLDLLDYRFYGPEDLWTFIPEIHNHTLVDTTIDSYFKFRNLSPSFGVSRSTTPALDSAKIRFNRWKNRLRMNSVYDLPSGHYGSSFLRKYKNEIIAHPEWRGKNSKGEFRNWKQDLKLCYSHPEVIELYKKDALLRLDKLKKSSSTPYFINMEPPDGDGFCNCTDCGSVSNQVYGLANEVAKYLYDIDTNVIVTLYGYNEHAEAPTFPLNKNILVGIVPYAFQSIGSPEKMMAKWESTGAKLYLRDYLGIPIWNYDKAVYSPNSNVLTKIIHLKDQNYLGYTFETTASFMSVGLNFFLLSSASWQNVDNNQVYQNFLKNMFPGQEEEVSLILENLPLLNKNTFGDALGKIRNLQADKKNSDEQTVLRLQDIEFYIEYLYLLDEFLSNTSDENMDILLNKIMSYPASRLLHPYGLYRVLQRKKNTDRVIQRTKNTPVQIQDSEHRQFALRRREVKEFKALNPDFYLKSLNGLKPIPIRNVNGILYVGNNNGGKVLFEAKLDKIYSTGNGSIIIRDMNNIFVNEISLNQDSNFHSYSLQLETNKFYKINFKTPSSVIYFRGFNRPFAFTEPLFNRYLNESIPFYFKIPDNQDNVLIEIPRKSNEVIIRSEGETLMSKSQYDPYIIELSSEGGKIIEIEMYRHGLKLINIPQLISLHPEAVIFQKNLEVIKNISPNN